LRRAPYTAPMLLRGCLTAAFALLLGSCQIVALVGENPDAATPADLPLPEDRATPRPDVSAAPDLPIAILDTSTPPDVGGSGPTVPPTDAAPVEEGIVGAMDSPEGRPDRETFTRDAPLASLEVGREDATPPGVDGGAAQITEAGATLDIPPTTDDAITVMGMDVVGASCRRDLDCARDPAGRFCGLMTMRCGPSP